jgi:hypothetical protein
MRVQYTKNNIAKAVKNSKNWREVINYLRPNSNYRGSESHIKKCAIKFNIDFSHFPGRGWNKGKRLPSKNPLSEYLSGERFIKSNDLKQRLFKDKIKNYKCEECNLSEWRQQPIPLELHHIDNNPKNNNLTNLKILCSNCHSLVHKNSKPKKVKEYKLNNCSHCLKPCKNKFCSEKCYHKSTKGTRRDNSRKVIWPDKEILINLVKEKSFLQIGRIFGVSDNAVRKWCNKYGIDMSISKFKIKKKKI